MTFPHHLAIRKYQISCLKTFHYNLPENFLLLNITKDNFPEAKKYLFGPGLEEEVSKWVETAQVITTALNPSRDQRCFVMSSPSNIPGQTRITGITAVLTREGSGEHPTFQVFETSCSRAHNVNYPKYTVKHFFSIP